ncbi:hypothetical protein TcasGA2_TC002429 [Tribolium castaneum]|uniref:Uncharacterized protein n=1 Tax=Tribolium castaneum TaxID=7070 RepID=D6WIG6_TRICA|nr:hypothetical protein TcasGA2_TC002429 [Tribolium castaneum]
MKKKMGKAEKEKSTFMSKGKEKKGRKGIRRGKEEEEKRKITGGEKEEGQLKRKKVINLYSFSTRKSSRRREDTREE